MEILDFIFPPVCGICGKIDTNYICKECEKNIKIIEKDKIEYYKNAFYKEHFYIFQYEGIIRKKIIDYKFNDASYLYKTFEKIMLNDKKVCEFIKTYDIIIPVPIHKKRKLERGYNQSELIIKKLLKDINKEGYINIELNNSSLTKIKNTQKQSSLKKEERRKNVEGSYILKNGSCLKELHNKNILIFDDIYTTGNTLNECAKIIHKANPNKIAVLTLAKD